MDAAKVAGAPLDGDALWGKVRADVEQLYRSAYWEPIGGAFVMDQGLANDLLDCAVNLGVGQASLMLQRCLNVLNDGGKRWPDVVLDAQVGARTLASVSFCNVRGDIPLVRKALHALRGARYIELAEKNPSLERFVKGWLTRA